MLIAHGQNWNGHDLTGWIVSEKYDGVRAVWDGANLYRRARSGNGLGHRIEIPDWLRDELMQHGPFDSELWMGRGTFAAAKNLAVYGNGDWRRARFMVFDRPGERTAIHRLTGIEVEIPFENRMENGFIPSLHIQHAGTRRAFSTADAMNMARQIIAAGGEGVVAVHPDMMIHPGRTERVLKIKARQLREFEAMRRECA